VSTTAAHRSAGPSERRQTTHRNEVLLVGTLQTEPVPRSLSDGTDVVIFRLLVRRDDEGTGTDSVECTSAAAGCRRAAAGWVVGDELEITGSLRRRFYRAGATSRPFTVVDVMRARRLGGATRRRTRG
jgi:single-strand DNA-binding protein